MLVTTGNSTSNVSYLPSSSPYHSYPDYNEDENLKSLFGLTSNEIVNRLPVHTIPLLVEKNPKTMGPNEFWRIAREEFLRRWDFLSAQRDEIAKKCNLH